MQALASGLERAPAAAFDFNQLTKATGKLNSIPLLRLQMHLNNVFIVGPKHNENQFHESSHLE